MHVKDTLGSILKLLVKDRYPLKVEVEVNKMIEQINTGVIEEWMWRKIIDKMYDTQDAYQLEQKFLSSICHREEIANLITSEILLGH